MKEEKLNNTIEYNLFGDSNLDIVEENLETAALMFKLLLESDMKIYREDEVRQILESDNPFNKDYLKFYDLSSK